MLLNLLLISVVIHTVSCEELYPREILTGSSYVPAQNKLQPNGVGWSIADVSKFIFLMTASLIGILSTAALAVTLTIMVFIMTGKCYKTHVHTPSRLQGLQCLLKQVSLKSPLHHVSSFGHYACTPMTSFKHQLLVFSTGIEALPSTTEDNSPSDPVEAALAQLLNSALKCELLPWYNTLVTDTKPAMHSIKECAWYVMDHLTAICKSLDLAAFLTHSLANCLTKHLQAIRQAQIAGEKIGDQGIFHLMPQLSSPERERSFLRRLSEYLLLQCLPPCYYNCVPVRTVLREVLACKILEVTIDCVCSPEWINEQIVKYLKDTPAPPPPSVVHPLADLVLHSQSADVSWRIEELIRAIQDCSDEDKLENARQVLHQELLQCTSSNNGSSAFNKQGTPLKVLDTMLSERCVSELTRARAECERRLLAVKAGLHDDQDSTCKTASFSNVLESSFCRQYLHSYLLSLHQTTVPLFTSFEDSTCLPSLPVTSSGVAALGLYCALQELLSALPRQHESLRSQIYQTYIYERCLYPVPIDETQKKLIWQLVLKGTSPRVDTGSFNCQPFPPLIGWLAGAVEEVGQFLQTRYSTGFLHSSQYRMMMEQATAIGYQIPVGMTDSPSPHLNELGASTKTASMNGGSPLLTLQHQLRHAHSCLSLYQERQLYKGWAVDSLSTADPAASEECLQEMQEITSNLRQYENHLRYLQLWVDNLGKWRIHVQSVDLKEEKDNPEITLLVSLEAESHATRKSKTPSPQPPQSPQPSRSSKSLVTNNTSTLLYNTIRDSTSNPNSSIPDPGTSVNQGNVESLKAAKSKSLSFEKESSLACLKTASFEKSSSSLDRVQPLAEKTKLVFEKQVKSIPPQEKSSESLKSKSAQGSLEKLFGNLSKSSSCCSCSEITNSNLSSYTVEYSANQLCESTTDIIDCWLVVKKLSHFIELHKKLCYYWPKLKSREVPSMPSKSIFSKQSSAERLCMDKLRASTQRYLSALTWDALDPGPARSAIFYEFVCPTQNLLWRPVPLPPKKSKFSLSSFFKGREGKADSDDEESSSTGTITEPLGRRLASLSDTGSIVTTMQPQQPSGVTLTTSLTSQFFGDKKQKAMGVFDPETVPNFEENTFPATALAGSAGGVTAVTGATSADALMTEPIFALLEELCELKGMGKWHRKTLVSIVQMTYGKNITRQMREFISNLLTPEKLVSYLNEIEEVIWPVASRCMGHESRSQQTFLRPSDPSCFKKSAKQISENKAEAREAVLKVLPELLMKLVGQQNARRGAHRLFITLQHHALNKNLFYNILEDLLQEIFPELKHYLMKTK